MKKMVRSLGLAVLICAVLATGHFATDQKVAQAQEVCDFANGVLTSSLGNGINCIDGNGVHPLEIPISFAPTSADDFAICPDTGNLLVLHFFGLAVYDGSSWSELELPDEALVTNSLACDASGQIWIAHTDGVSVYSAGAWTSYGLDVFGTGEFIYEVSHIRAGTDGSVWASTPESIAQLDEAGAWTVYEGFENIFSIGGLALDANNMPVVGYGSGVLTFDGTTFTPHENDWFGGDPVAVAPDGTIWLGSLTEGVASFDGSTWTVFDRDAGLSSNTVHDVKVDSSGRVWVGTEHGLNVYDGSAWTIFYQDNSGLADNTVRLVHPLGAPTLPALVQEAPGSVSGVIVLGRDPVANTRVELCTELLGGTFYGDTPCADHAGAMLTTTNDAGEFTFENVPVGRYEVTIETADGWIYFVGTESEISVEEGAAVDMGFVDVAQ